MDERIAFARSFAKKMLLLAVCAGLLVSLSLPITYYQLSAAERERNNALRAKLMADSIAEAIRDNEELWYYDVPRFIEISHRLPREEQVTAIRIMNENRRVLYEEVRQIASISTFESESPIYFNSRLYGYLSLEESKFDLMLNSVLVLVIFALMGCLLAVVLYRYPVKMVRDAESVVSCVVDELNASHDKLRNLAIHDGKTQLYNATYLMELLEEAVEESRQKREPLYIAMLDLDYFKKYNDYFGHLSGDVVLVAISEILRQNVRPTDILGRFGGEEFIVILPHTDRQCAESIVKRLHTTIAKQNFTGQSVLPGGNLTVSIGLACYEPAMTLSELIHAADMAMYMAKESGRNRICVCSGAEYYIDGKKMVRLCDLSFQNHSFQQLIQVLDQSSEDQRFTGQVSSLISYLKTLDSRESDTAQHSFLVNRIAMALGRQMKLPENELLQLNWGTLLHDIGKLGIGDSILLKRTGLSKAEYEIMKRHPQVGYELVKDNNYLTSASRVVLCHHERWDGCGYPNKLQGNHISLLARICSVADTVAAMAEDRPYRKALPLDEIVRELQRNAGLQFDPWIVEVFMAIPDKRALIFEQALAV